MATLESILAEHPFFEDLDASHSDQLLNCVSNRFIRANHFVFREGEPANEFFVIREGQLAVEAPTVDGPLIVQTLDAGSIVGWSWLIPPFRWRFDVRALRDTLLLSLSAPCLREKCAQNHELGYELHRRFSRIMAQRLEGAMLRLLDVQERSHELVQEL